MGASKRDQAAVEAVEAVSKPLPDDSSVDSSGACCSCTVTLISSVRSPMTLREDCGDGGLVGTLAFGLARCCVVCCIAVFVSSGVVDREDDTNKVRFVESSFFFLVLLFP